MINNPPPADPAASRRRLLGAFGALGVLVGVGRPAFAQAGAGPAWSQLTPAQQNALGPVRGQWDRFDADGKRKWLDMANRMPSMPPAERERMQQRMQNWAQMSPQEREQTRQNYRELKKRPPEERQRAWEQYRQLPEEERRRLSEEARRQRPPAGGNRPGRERSP